MESKRPFAILLGGNHPNALLELHDLRFTMATDSESAFRQVAYAWFGDLKTAHVDAWMDLSEIDGYSRVSESEGEPNKTLFFVNIGGYQKDVFNEEHRYLFFIAEDIKAAKLRAVTLMKKELILTHVDNTEEVDQIIPIAEIESQKLFWKSNAEAAKPTAHTGYWPLKKYQSE